MSLKSKSHNKIIDLTKIKHNITPLKIKNKHFSQFNSPDKKDNSKNESQRFEKSSFMLGNNRNYLSTNLIEDINDLKCKLISQRYILKEYENWIQILLNIIYCKEEEDIIHNDYSSQIEKVYILSNLELRENLSI